MMGWWQRIWGSSDRYVDDWVRGIERTLNTAAGVRVTVADALTLPGVAACIEVLSQDIAKVPLVLKRRTGSGGDMTDATEHPLYGLLRYGPAPWLSSYVWRKALAHATLAHGNGYVRVRRDSRFQLQQMSNIRPGSVTVRWTADGEPFYDVTAFGGRVETGLTWYDVLHVPYRASCDGACDGGVIGVSPIMQNREALGAALATERFAAKFFANGARPSMIIEMDRKLPNDEVGKRIRASIERLYSGADNAFKVAILELGMKMQTFSVNPEESQLIETRKEQAVQTCMLYNVPPHKIGILDRATFSNIEQQGIDYVTGPISSLAQNIESAIEIACLTPEERSLYSVRHNLDALMRGDILSRYRAYAIGRQWGWLSADDVRGFEDMNRLPDDQGKVYLSPMNMVPADQQDPALDPSQDPPPDNADPAPPGNDARRRAALTAARRINGFSKLLLGPDGNPWRH